ncbi:MAG: bppU [Bacteriophage sp.]|nr:MAG: bppU [Bacteriophage sp.]
MAYDVLDNVYSIFMDVKTGVGGSSGSNTFYNTDVNTSFIEIILTERDKNLTMTDYTYIVSVDKADGTSYVNRYTASEANKMSIKLDTQLLACEGECTAQLYVLKDDKVRTMMEFNYFVKNGVFDGAKPPSHNEDSIYISLMKEFTDLKENVLIAIGKMDGIESSIESVKNIADTNTNTINSEKKKTEANTSTIEGHTRSISEINNTLQTHSDKIQASEETITQHTEKLQGHDRKLEEYNTTIQEHGRTLESQGASITEQGEKISKLKLEHQNQLMKNTNKIKKIFY